MSASTHAADDFVSPVDRENISSEDLELLDDFDRNTTQPTGAYIVEFTGTKLLIADSIYSDITCILKMDKQTVSGFKSTMRAIAQSGSRSPRSLQSNISILEKAIRDVPIANFTPESYLSALIEN